MPELPEVETVRNTLKQYVINHRVESVDSYWDNIIVGEVDAFRERIYGQVIHDVKRLGKFLIFELDQDVMISHLRMEGKYFYCDYHDPVEKHTHVCIHLDKGKDLRYHDVRKFGKLQLVDKSNYLEVEPLNRLGKEPFHITVDELYSAFQKTSLPIKTALLDQGMIAGIGNIYANEICFVSKIDPYRKARDLSKEEVALIIEKSIYILNRAIEQGGTSIHTFSSNGITGLFQQQLFVHGKNNQPCQICGSLILKEKINQRGTYYCPTCQEVKKK